MMLRDFEEKQAANNEKENEEKDTKVCYLNVLSILCLCTLLLLYFSLMPIVQS